MFRNSKLKILQKIGVFAVVFVFVFSPLGNMFEPYLQRLPLPEPAKEFTRKVSQTRTAQAVTDVRSPTVDAGTGVVAVCADNMVWQNTGASAMNANDSSFANTNDAKFDSTDVSDELRAYTFGFTLTNVSSIDGFTVDVLAWTSAGGATYTDVVLFTAPGTRRGEDKSDGTTLPVVDPDSTYKSFGGATDDWYTAGSWTEAEVESANFGVALCFTSTGTDTIVNVDHIQITVHYTQSAPADLSWNTGAADFEIWAGATATTDAVLTWDNGTLICSTALTDDNTRQSTCGAINKKQKYRVQAVLDNIGGAAVDMAAGDFVDQVNVKTFWAGTSPTIAAVTDCGFADGVTFGETDDDGSTTCNVAFNGNDVRITNIGAGSVVIPVTTGTEGFMYLITTDSNIPLSDPSAYMNASIDSITEDSSRITIGLKRVAGNYIRGLVKIRGYVKFR